MKRFVLITGASSGIGQHTCLSLARKGYEVLAGVRTVQDADRLRKEGGNTIHPLIMDVTDDEGMGQAKTDAENIIGDGSLIAIVNNAGIAIHGAILYIPLSEWRRQLEVNVIGVLRTTQLFFPLLAKPRQEGDHHPRRIINISSVSGLFASPFIGPYVASKHALEGLSDSLRRELYMHDIQVVIIEPGNISTPIWEKARMAPSYFGKEHGPILAYKDRILDKQLEESIAVNKVEAIIVKAVVSRHVKVRYLVKWQKWKFNLIRRLPAKWVDRLIHDRLRKKSGIRPF